VRATRQSFPLWKDNTINLLNNHQVHLLGDPGFYLFYMKEEGHDEVRWYRFEPPAGGAALKR
jgi:hypothetical protein